MNRLTDKRLYRFMDKTHFTPLPKDKEEILELKSLDEDKPAYRDLYMALAEYEDLDESERLVKLPCKVGTKCYAVEMSCSYGWEYRYGKRFPNEHSCNGCVNKCDGEYGVYEIVLHTICDIINVKEQIGVSIFFTREEAEKALKEREASET